MSRVRRPPRQGGAVSPYGGSVCRSDLDRVRVDERTKKGLFEINGVELGPVGTLLSNGHKLIEYRADIAVRAIQQAIGS